MLAYIGRRALLAIFTVWAISVLSFAIIQLPPGDYVTSYIAQMASMGSVVTDEEAQNLRIQYGLGQPIYVQYFKWMKLIVHGNFGMSMEWRRPVTEVIGERLWLTVVVSVAALHPHLGPGAAHRHLLGGPPVLDRRLRRRRSSASSASPSPTSCSPWCCSTSASCCSTPTSAGCSRPSCRTRRGAWRKVWDLLKHLPIPALILGLAGTAQQIRIMRANLLDELRKPYVVTARSKGLPEAQRDPEVSGARGPQPVREHHRLHAALHRLGQHHRVAGARPADGRAAAAQGAHRAGHVPGRAPSCCCSGS